MLNFVCYLDGIKHSGSTVRAAHPASPQFELHTHSRLFVVNINRKPSCDGFFLPYLVLILFFSGVVVVNNRHNKTCCRIQLTVLVAHLGFSADLHLVRTKNFQVCFPKTCLNSYCNTCSLVWILFFPLVWTRFNVSQRSEPAIQSWRGTCCLSLVGIGQGTLVCLEIR